jgi:hypothetical protein
MGVNASSSSSTITSHSNNNNSNSSINGDDGLTERVSKRAKPAIAAAAVVINSSGKKVASVADALADLGMDLDNDGINKNRPLDDDGGISPQQPSRHPPSSSSSSSSTGGPRMSPWDGPSATSLSSKPAPPLPLPEPRSALLYTKDGKFFHITLDQ